MRTRVDSSEPVIVDAVVRHIPGVLGAEGGAERESHADGVLEGAHYTRPPEFRGLSVPQALLDGNHAEIEAWRREDGLRRQDGTGVHR